MNVACRSMGIATAWLFGLMFVVDARVPLILAGLAILAGPLLGNVPLRRMVLGMAPLWAAALGITVFNTLFAAANSDPALPAIAQIGLWRITAAGLAAGIAVGSRVFAIVAVGILFGQTTDATRLADSLGQQGRLAPRFAYGALAAYPLQSMPRLKARTSTAPPLVMSIWYESGVKPALRLVSPPLGEAERSRTAPSPLEPKSMPAAMALREGPYYITSYIIHDYKQGSDEEPPEGG